MPRIHEQHHQRAPIPVGSAATRRRRDSGATVEVGSAHVAAPVPAAPRVEEAVDPVCGMTMSPDGAAAQRNNEAETIYFCSTHCAATYDADPARYAHAAAR
jgi:YHS domain-containing protein